jgi:YD repeat-containing protein
MFLVVMTAVVSAQSGSGIQYFYDDLGRLIKVVDQSGNFASYTYDAVGNILKIDRGTIPSPATLTIFNFNPSQGGVGATVTIQGQRFNPTAALNTVSFNGTAATVLSATASSIVTTVPAGASTGPITVTANGQTATSDTYFIFIPSPAILSINPKFVVTSPATTQISNFTVTGVALNSATFAFQPATVPPTISITSVAADSSGTSATLSLSIAANAAGSFTLVATNGSGSSSQVPSAANTLRIISPDGDDDNDGLTNAVEIALGTDPFNASTAGDGISDGWKVFYGLDPINPIASQDPDGDGLTNLQEFQAGTDPRNPDVTPPAVAQVFPSDQSTGFPTNGRIVVRFTEPLLNGVNLTATQTAIQRVAPSLPGANQATAAQILQAYLQRTCCATSIVPGIVNLTQSGTPVGGSVQLSNDGLSVTFTPAQKLLPTTPYSLQVNNVRDVAGNRMTTAFQSNFTTGAADDLAPPMVI